eukprot:UN09735
MTETTQPDTTPQSNDNNNIQIETSRLILRLPHYDDVPAMVDVYNNKMMYETTLSLPYPYTEEHARGFIEFCRNKADTLTHFAVIDKQTGEFLGGVSFGITPKHQQAEVAWSIAEKHWGKGYCTEAAQALIDYGFTHKSLIKIFGRHFTNNPASGRVMMKIGMKHEGVLRSHVIKEGEAHDLYMYGILREEWEQQQKAKQQ